MKQAQFVAPLAQLDAHDVAYGEHADPAFATDYRQVARAVLLHPFERVVWRVAAINHDFNLAHHVADRHIGRSLALQDDPAQQVTLREDAA
ncbi:MAG: hypothetical protein DMF64_21090 [Acidobacteria bacterium]|nr:MAG: hypothetical protein DMF64_21090 [Acidobacteriota bacterium]